MLPSAFCVIQNTPAFFHYTSYVKCMLHEKNAFCWRLVLSINMMKGKYGHAVDILSYSLHFRDGPLGNLWGGGGAKYQKNTRAGEN